MSTADDHLDLDALAAIDAGLDDAPAREAHVRECPECSQRLAQVRSTRALLAALPDEPMPAEVAARLHAALPEDPPASTIVPAGIRRRRWSHAPSLAGLGAAAAGVALIAAIAIGATRSSNHGGSEAGSGGTAGASSAAGTGSFPVISSGSHYTDANAGTSVAALDSLARVPHAPEASPQSAGAARTNAQDALSFSSNAPVPAALRPLYDDRTALLQCVARLAGGPTRPVAVDFARFTGGLRHVKNAPAIVILLPGLTSSAADVAFIVGPKCLTDPSQDLYAFQGAVRPG